MRAAKRIVVIAVAGCWVTGLNAQSTWQHSQRTTDQNGKTYCQTMSPQGLGFRFYDEAYYVIGFLDVDASSNIGLKKIIDGGEANVVLQPDTVYAYFTSMRHEATERKVVGDQGIRRPLSRFSITGGDYHLIEAMQDATTLNVIVTEDAGRIVTPTLADVDYSISLAGSADAFKKALDCIE